MRTKLSLVFSASLLFFLTGCVGISIGGCGQATPPPAVVVTPAPLGSSDAATMAEIDAAARLNFDNQRLASLKTIAQRPGLGAAAQVRLVNAAYGTLSFDNQRVDLLKTIIAHPEFNDATRQAIVVQLNKLGFDNHRQEILSEINKRLSGK